MTKDPILFVDDDALYLRLLECIVDQHGINAHYATSGAQALEVMRAHHCDTMITDLHMPVMDGYKLSKQARKLLPDLQIVMVTADASSEVSRMAGKLGISVVVEKPNTLKKVQEVLNVALSNLPDRSGAGAEISKPGTLDLLGLI